MSCNRSAEEFDSDGHSLEFRAAAKAELAGKTLSAYVYHAQKLEVLQRQVRSTPSMFVHYALHYGSSAVHKIQIDFNVKKRSTFQSSCLRVVVWCPQPTAVPNFVQPKQSKKESSLEYVKLPDRENIATGTRRYASRKSYELHSSAGSMFPNARPSAVRTCVRTGIYSQGDF